MKSVFNHFDCGAWIATPRTGARDDDCGGCCHCEEPVRATWQSRNPTSSVAISLIASLTLILSSVAAQPLLGTLLEADASGHVIITVPRDVFPEVISHLEYGDPLPFFLKNEDGAALVGVINKIDPIPDQQERLWLYGTTTPSLEKPQQSSYVLNVQN